MRRISLQDESEHTSGFFAKHQARIFETLVDDGAPTPSSLVPLYVTKRCYSAAPNEIASMLDRLPPEFSDLFDKSQIARQDKVKSPSLRIDFYELDLLDFLFNVKKNRVLRVVGSVGVGKTTFLRYIFSCLRETCPSLRRYIPVFIGFMKYPTGNLRDDDLSDIIWTALIESLEHESEARAVQDLTTSKNLRALADSIKNYGKIAARTDGLYALFSFVSKELKEYCDFELVFVFDNVDHLSGQSVATVSQCARALFQLTRSCVILAMRPPAFATDLETDAHRGAFYTFRIVLPPPSLASILLRRMRRIVITEPIEYIKDGTPFTFLLSDVERAIRNTINNVLDEQNERLLLVGIANNNIRFAAAAFARFLRWPGLRPDLIMEPWDERSRALPGGFSEHLMKGLMLGSNTYYRDESRDRPAISNILVFRSQGFKPDYLLQHRIFSLLEWAGATIPSHRLEDWLVTFGYERSHSRLCVEHMLRRGLLFSPETETSAAEAEYISISESGRFYLQHFFSNPEYLLEAILDVDLLHSNISSTSHVTFVGRISSIFEYLQYVEAAEKGQIQSLLKNAAAFPHVLGAIYKSGLLQRAIISALRPLVRRMHKSAIEEVSSAADGFEEKWETSAAWTDDAEKRIAEIMFSAHLLVPGGQVEREVFRRAWGHDNELTIDAPRTLTSGNSNRVDVRCHLPSSERVERLYSRVKITNLGIDEFITLDRSGISHDFGGHINLSWRGEPSGVQEMFISLFGDTKPLLQTTLSSQINE